VEHLLIVTIFLAASMMRGFLVCLALFDGANAFRVSKGRGRVANIDEGNSMAMEATTTTQAQSQLTDIGSGPCRMADGSGAPSHTFFLRLGSRTAQRECESDANCWGYSTGGSREGRDPDARDVDSIILWFSGPLVAGGHQDSRGWRCIAKNKTVGKPVPTYSLQVTNSRCADYARPTTRNTVDMCASRVQQNEDCGEWFFFYPSSGRCFCVPKWDNVCDLRASNIIVNVYKLEAANATQMP